MFVVSYNIRMSVGCLIDMPVWCQVMELLVHVNKRLKSRPAVQLPVETLLLQYQDPAASSFLKVTCGTIQYTLYTI